MKKTGKVYKLCVCIPYNFGEENEQYRISIAANPLSRQKHSMFLKSIITGDEKRLFSENVNAKGSGLTTENLLNLPHRPSFIEERFPCVYAAAITVLFILNF